MIGGNLYGVAHSVNIVSIRVLNGDGSGSISGIIKGLDYIAKRHTKDSTFVVNMSIGGGKSRSLDMAINNLVKRFGIHFVVAAVRFINN